MEPNLKIVKSFTSFIFITVMFLGINYLHREYQYSITFFDLIFFPLFIYIDFIALKFLFSIAKLKPKVQKNVHSLKVIIGTSIVVTIVFIGGWYFIISSINNPLGHSEIFDSCFSHGYTQFVQGIFALLFTCIAICEMIFTGVRKKI